MSVALAAFPAAWEAAQAADFLRAHQARRSPLLPVWAAAALVAAVIARAKTVVSHSAPLSRHRQLPCLSLLARRFLSGFSLLLREPFPPPPLLPRLFSPLPFLL